MTSIMLPDSFSYNGLGMRLSKSDPTGNYWYFNDGVSPASDVLSDNYSTFTPGIGETKGVGNNQYASEFYLADASGNSRGLLNGSQGNTDGYNWDAFGNLVSRFGSNPTGFAWNVSSGYQTDNDDGLTLLGHRYYDKRTGRFISQDHAKDGGNWYRYASNNPVNKTDPTGLSDGLPGTLGAPDQHYGGLGGFLDGGGMSSLDGFWDSENASEVRGSTEYVASVAIQRANIKGTGDFSNVIKGSLEQIATTGFGANLLAEFVWNPHVLNITEIYNHPEDIGYAAQNDVPGVGFFTNTVLFETDHNISVYTTEGWQPISWDVALEHELGHDITYDGNSEIPDPGPGGPNGTENTLTGTDVESVYENPYRAELGLPLRLNHAGKITN